VVQQTFIYWIFMLIPEARREAISLPLQKICIYGLIFAPVKI